MSLAKLLSLSSIPAAMEAEAWKERFPGRDKDEEGDVEAKAANAAKPRQKKAAPPVVEDAEDEEPTVPGTGLFPDGVCTSGTLG